MLTLRLLPSSFEPDGSASSRQHYSCYVVNGCVAFDAGSLANGVTDAERAAIRDVVLTHAHLDHIAGLPIFLDDLFPLLTEPVRVHASGEVIDVLESHIFNGKVYPRFSELENDFGKVIEYREIRTDRSFDLQGLRVRAISVNHNVPSNGFLIRDETAAIAITGDTAEMSGFWKTVNEIERIDALFVECAFPNEFEELASISHHLTPQKLQIELGKITVLTDSIFVINMKPAYRNAIVEQLKEIPDARLQLLEVGREYRFG